MTTTYKAAVILAGGQGTRLYPFTLNLPKPLLPLGDYPILEVIVKQLQNQGFSRIVMAVNHQANLIMDYFGNGSKWGLHIDYSIEKKVLGTMGPLTIIRDLPNDFLVMNGDILTDLNYLLLHENHVANGSMFTIASHAVSEVSPYGVLHTDHTGEVVNFEEKPIRSSLVSMGVYVLNASLISLIPMNKRFGFDELVLSCLKNGRPVVTSEYLGYWRDLGTPEDYKLAQEEFTEGPGRFI